MTERTRPLGKKTWFGCFSSNLKIRQNRRQQTKECWGCICHLVSGQIINNGSTDFQLHWNILQFITLNPIKVVECRSFISGWIKILLLPNWKLLLLTSPVIGLKCLSHLVANNLWKGPPSIFNPHIETCAHTHTHWEQEQMWPSTAPLPKSNVPGLLWSRETTGAVVKYIVKGNRWLYLQCRDSQHIHGVPSGIDCKIRGRTSFSTCSLFTSAV